MSKRQKSVTVIICLLLILALGGAMIVFAYLFDSETATNTFTVGKVEITLDEEDIDESSIGLRDKQNIYKMIPGEELKKDPLVTVKGRSHASWVFVEVIDNEVSYNGETYRASDFLTYGINQGADGWTKLDGVNNVYYYQAPATDTDFTLPNILIDNKVIVKSGISKDMFDNVAKEAVYPELSFKAYAFQVKKGDTNGDGVIEEFTAAQAWEALHN